MLVNKESGQKKNNGRFSELKNSDQKVYELVTKEAQQAGNFDEYHGDLMEALKENDGDIYRLVSDEYSRLKNTIQLIAAENQCSRAVLGALGSIVQNKTTEGFPGRRYHGGSEIVDRIEKMACDRAKTVFGARYANVQPHSGTAANQIVMTAILEKDDRILGLGLDQGGHVSHGAKVSFTGKFFETEHYCVDPETFLIDYDAVRQKAKEVQPRLIICGASAYARSIDFAKFREIADEVGAFLMADVSHISGLIAAAAHESPIDHAHFVTTSTYKPGGPRGGLVLMGRDFDMKVKAVDREIELYKLVDKATFPGVQGTPYLNHIAAKAVFFKEMMSEEYRQRQYEIIRNAKVLSDCLEDLGYDVLTGGTDNHMVVVNVASSRPGLTGVIAQQVLEDCGIIVNMNKLPYDEHKTTVTSGMRLGTPIVTKNGMGAEEMECISKIIDEVFERVEVIDERTYYIDHDFKEQMRRKVQYLCRRFPLS